MSEIKPRAYYVGALNAFTTSKDEAEKMGKQFPVEALYPAAAYEALQKENESLRKQVEMLLGSARKTVLALAHASIHDPLYTAAYNELSESIKLASKNGD